MTTLKQLLQKYKTFLKKGDVTKKSINNIIEYIKFKIELKHKSRKIIIDVVDSLLNTHKHKTKTKQIIKNVYTKTLNVVNRTIS